MREQTFGDFVAECKMYQFSEERFNIMKEMSEFKLMEQYIENQSYINENSDFIESVVLKDGYLSESADSLTLIELTESANKKGESIWKKLINGIVKIWKTFIRFLKRIMNVFDKLNRQAVKARLILKKLNIDDNVFAKLENIVKLAYSKSEPFIAYPNQPFLKRIKFNYTGNGSNDINKVKNDLAAALSTSYAYAKLFRTGKNDYFVPIPIDDINSSSKQYFKKKAANLKNAIDIIKNSIENSMNKGVEIDVNNNRLEKIIKNLQELSEKINKEFSAFWTNPQDEKPKTDPSTRLNGNNMAQKALPPGKEDWEKSVITGVAKEIHKESYDLEDEYFNEGVEEYDGGNLELASRYLDMLTRCIGDIITLYTSYNKYRKFIIEGILKFDMDESSKDLLLPGGDDTKYLPPEGSKAKVSGKETPRIPGGRGHVVGEDEIANELKRRERNKVRV